MVEVIDDSGFDSAVKQSDKPVLVDFFATWCGPCKQMEGPVEELAKEFEGKVKVVKVDVDKAQQSAMGLGISSVPTFLLFKDGQAIGKEVGAVGKEGLKRMIERALE